MRSYTCKLLLYPIKIESTLEEAVVYQVLTKSKKFKKNMKIVEKKVNFLEEVEYNEERVPRFKYIETKAKSK